MKTISIPEELHKEIVNLKLGERKKNTAELIEELVLLYKKRKFSEAGEKFRKALKENKKNFSDILKESKKIKEEIADEWLRD